MGTSSTKGRRWKNKKRKALDNPVVDQVLTQAVKFLHHWTQRELHKLNSNGQVFILPGRNKNEYLVGKYRLEKQNDRCWTVSNDEKRIHDFYDRRAALFYCMGTQGGKYTPRADEILMLDTVVSKLSSDQMHYTHTLTCSKKQKNWLQYDIVQARLTEISTKLEYAQEQLEKSLGWAKYNKTQDGSHETTRTRN
jgi:hypothetical protein